MTSNPTYYHYVYRITNILEQKHYYGKRSTLTYPNEDLGLVYFSSSTDALFINDQRVNPSHYKYKIVKICKTGEDAIKLESILHKKFNVGHHDRFYNKANQTLNGFDASGKFPAKLSATGEYVGLIACNDARYKLGELVSVNFGVPAPKPADFGARQSARQRGVPKRPEDVAQRRQTMSTPDALGKTIFDKVGEKVVQRKSQTFDKFGRTMFAVIGEKSASTKRASIDADGLDGFGRAAIQCQVTNSMVGEDGLTGYQRRGFARRRSKSNPRFNVVHIDNGIVLHSLTSRECKAIAYSLPSRLSVDDRIGATKNAQKRLITTGKEHLIGLYLQPIPPIQE